MATITITTNAATAAIAAHAFGVYLGLGRDATLPEIQAQLVVYAKSIMAGVQRAEAVIDQTVIS